MRHLWHNESVFSFDTRGRITSVDIDGIRTTCVYHGDFALPRQSEKDGTVTRYAYDATGHLLGWVQHPDDAPIWTVVARTGPTTLLATVYEGDEPVGGTYYRGNCARVMLSTCLDPLAPTPAELR